MTRLILLALLLASCTSPLWQDTERIVPLHDDTCRMIPDLGCVTLAFPLPVVDSFTVTRVDLRLTIRSQNWSDLEARLDMADHEAVLWDNEGNDEDNPFTDWRYTYLFYGNPGGDTLRVTVEDCLEEDVSWWRQTELAIHYERTR